MMRSNAALIATVLLILGCGSDGSKKSNSGDDPKSFPSEGRFIPDSTVKDIGYSICKNNWRSFAKPGNSYHRTNRRFFANGVWITDHQFNKFLSLDEQNFSVEYSSIWTNLISGMEEQSTVRHNCRAYSDLEQALCSSDQQSEKQTPVKFKVKLFGLTMTKQISNRVEYGWYVLKSGKRVRAQRRITLDSGPLGYRWLTNGKNPDDTPSGNGTRRTVAIETGELPDFTAVQCSSEMVFWSEEVWDKSGKLVGGNYQELVGFQQF